MESNSEIRDHTLCLGNISKDFTIDNIKKTDQEEFFFFLVDFNSIDTKNVLDIHKYLMKKMI